MHGRDRGEQHTTITAPMRVRYTTQDGKRVRYAASEGPAEQVILLTSPWPEGGYAFAPIWPLLAPRCRLFAVDLPGFGGSDRRDDLLSPAAMGEFLARLIDGCALGHPHVVAPDIGTSAALFAAASHPELVPSVVVGSGGLVSPTLARRLPTIETPVQIIAGGRDRIVPLVNAEVLAERLPHGTLTMVDAAHFVWEEAPGEYASIVTDWVERRSV